MPILFVCMINEKSVFVTDAMGTKTTGDFKQQVQKRQSQFVTYAKRQIPIDSEINLAYRDSKTYTVVCISTGYDIKEIEAQTFLEKAEELIMKHLDGGDLESSISISKKGLVVNNDYMGSQKDKSRLNSVQNVDTEQSMTLANVGEIDQDTLEDKRHRQTFKKLKSALEKFTREWNENE